MIASTKVAKAQRDIRSSVMIENATQNAGEMIGKLTMTYNRGRQAVITNELIDIITGASALENIH
ncbi:hypothetical protein HPULCUR_003747 [Helicostylum pulchrum]|uniref:ATP synthase subunit gamma, mitochondrial n=1 Tax=Helicostylum pulchrum TaxID=562976 RepID=A0ABP9XU86_9FUNG